MIGSLKSKRGLAKDILGALVFLLVFSVSAIVAYALYDGFMSEFEENNLLESGAGKRVEEGFNNAMRSYDYILLIVFVILNIGLGITTYKIASPPIHFIVHFFLAAFYGIIAYLMNFAYAEFVSVPVISSIMNYFPISTVLLTNMHWLALFMLVLGSITTYVKKDQGQYA